jgi:hypothetical protein
MGYIMSIHFVGVDDVVSATQSPCITVRWRVWGAEARTPKLADNVKRTPEKPDVDVKWLQRHAGVIRPPPMG